jgi:hypothetical protein
LPAVLAKEFVYEPSDGSEREKGNKKKKMKKKKEKNNKRTKEQTQLIKCLQVFDVKKLLTIQSEFFLEINFWLLRSLMKRDTLASDIIATGKRHFTLKKVLLKLCLIREMKEFMHTPEIRHDPVKAPLIYRAYHRLKISPFFSHSTAEENEVMEKLIDILPKWQIQVLRATRRDPASEVRNAICNSWCVILATSIEIDVAEVMGKQFRYENLDDAKYMVPAAESSDDDESADPDHLSLDPALAARRARRRALASTMSLFMTKVTHLGIDDFISALENANSPDELGSDYKDVFVRMSSVMSLSLLAAYNSKSNRSKLMKVIELIPTWIIPIVCKIGNPFKLAVFAAKWAFTLKFPGGNTMLQAMVKEIVNLARTEEKLSVIGKEIDSRVQKQLLSLMDEGGDLVLSLSLSEIQRRFVKLERRRRDKQAMIDYSGSNDMRFLLLEALPLFGGPVLEHYETSDFGKQLQEAIGCVTGLIGAIEKKDEDAVDDALDAFRMLVFGFFKSTAIHNKMVVDLIFEWMKDSYADGPEVFDMDALLSHLEPEKYESLWKEVDQAILHSEAGGHLAAIEIPIIKQLCDPFQLMIAQRAVFKEEEVETMQPKKKGFFSRFFK